MKKTDFPDTNEPFLIITAWRSRKGKTIKIGRSQVVIPLSEAEHVQRIIKGKGDNYSVLAADDPNFKDKLDAWIDSGKLERMLADPAHGSKREKAPTKVKQRG